jgi:hypothetical protein
MAIGLEGNLTEESEVLAIRCDKMLTVKLRGVLNMDYKKASFVYFAYFACFREFAFF